MIETRSHRIVTIEVYCSAESQREEFIPACNKMQPVLNIFQTVDELDEDGVPKQTKEELHRFCKHISEYCVNYVNEPSVGLWHIQNHLHNKILPKHQDMKSKLLQALQDSREVTLELDSVSSFIPPANSAEECNKIMSETLEICQSVNKRYSEIIENEKKLKIENKAVDDVIAETVVNESSPSSRSGRSRGDSFEAWYKSQFKSS